jgi:hypothetical protein
MKPLFVLIDSETQSLLLDNQVDLVLELQRRGHTIERTLLPDPAELSIGQSRDAVLVILASAAVISALGIAISDILQALSRRPILVKNVEYKAIRGPDGEVIQGPDGKPVMEWIETSELLETTQPDTSTKRMEATLGGPRGLQIRISREK